MRTIALYKGHYVVRFDYDTLLVAAMKATPGARYNKEPKPHWAVPTDSFRNVINLINNHGFEVMPHAKNLLTSQIKEASAVVASSNAKDAKVKITGLGGELLPFQRAGVAYALQAKRTFIADEMGLGKTIEALATLQAAKAYPALVICPAFLKLIWQREIRKWLPGRTVGIIDSIDIPNGVVSKDSIPRTDIVITNYDILMRLVEASKRGKNTIYFPIDELAHRKFNFVVFDESHYCKNYKAQRTKAAQGLGKSVEYRLALTGTPVLNRPQELLSQLTILDRLNDLGGFWYFVKRYCGARQITVPQRGSHFKRDVWDFGGASHLDELNQRLRSLCYIRRLKSEVMADLPDKMPPTIIPIEIDNREEYDRVEHDLTVWLARRIATKKAFLKSIEDLTPEEQEKEIKARFKSRAEMSSRAEQLVKIEYTRQAALAGKLKAVREWISSFLETGEKLVVFAHHQEVVRWLADEFHAPFIKSGVSNKKKMEIIDDFQDNPKTKLVIINMKSGGLGLTITAASSAAFVEIGWSPSDMRQAIDRLHRKGQKNVVNAYYLLAEDTVEFDMYDVVLEKAPVVDEATEGDRIGEKVKVMAALSKKLVSGKRTTWEDLQAKTSRPIQTGKPSDKKPAQVGFSSKCGSRLDGLIRVTNHRREGS